MDRFDFESFEKTGSVTGWRRPLALCLALSCLELGLWAANTATITTFDPPGATRTLALSINPAGAITGYYVDGIFGGVHGFLRAPDGAFTTFDVPGALLTQASSIN